MDLATRLVEPEERTAQHRELLLKEKAAETALVFPFFRALGYDVFDPSEVIPECTADVGIKKGEKVRRGPGQARPATARHRSRAAFGRRGFAATPLPPDLAPPPPRLRPRPALTPAP